MVIAPISYGQKVIWIAAWDEILNKPLEMKFWINHLWYREMNDKYDVNIDSHFLHKNWDKAVKIKCPTKNGVLDMFIDYILM